MAFSQHNPTIRTTSLLSLTNGVLNRLGRSSVTNLQDRDDAILIAQLMPLWLGELLLKTNWTFATKYYFSNTPLVDNLEYNPYLSYQYPNDFALPADYGRFYKWIGRGTPTFDFDYQICGNIFQCRSSYIAMYYIVNLCEYSVITNAAFIAALQHYGASEIALTLTQRTDLETAEFRKYQMKIGDAIQQNAYECSISQTVNNDFRRQVFI